MLKNAYLDAKIGVDPAENEPRKEGCVAACRMRTVRGPAGGRPGVVRGQLAAQLAGSTG